MIVLGIKYPGHDSAAAVVVNGKVVAASAEERFDRRKHSRAFPFKSIEWCLGLIGASIHEVAAVAVQYNFIEAYKRSNLSDLLKLKGNSIRALMQNLRDDGYKHFMTEYCLRGTLGYRGPISYLDHHDCHAASAYYTSPFDTATVMTVDGRGERASTRLYIASPTGLRRVASVEFPHSIGMLYSKVTAYLGYKSDSEEGTVMGLAGYGEDRYVAAFQRLVNLGPGFAFTIDLDYFTYQVDKNGDVSKSFEAQFGQRRVHGADLENHHTAVAFALQASLVTCMKFLGQEAFALTKIPNLCLAGGCALNASANGILMNDLPFDGIYVQPAAGDDGSAMGAALLQYYSATCSEYQPNEYWSPYLGYEPTVREIESEINKSDNAYVEVRDPDRVAAWLLSMEFVVGWFQGKAEFGPRALGNRCILSAPFPVSMKERVNQIKNRENFRPFAPAVLIEEMTRLFAFWRPSPYMTFAYPLTELGREKMPAIAHIDGTARVQTVEESQNARFYSLLKSFKEITGIGVVLCTSMNSKGEPLVNTPQEALSLFERSSIDALIIDNYLIMKPHCMQVYIGAQS